MRKLGIFFAFFLLIGVPTVFAQNSITGKVTNKEDDLGIPGVTVIVQGTTMGTITDGSGNYSLSVPLNAKSLRFSFIGMKPIEAQIGVLKEINVTMESEISTLDEVVAVGYGTQKKVNVIGSVSTVSSEQITATPVASMS